MPDTSSSGSTAGSLTHTPTYSERLWVPIWWWPIGIGIAALLAAELHMGAPGMSEWLPYVVLIPCSLWALVWLSRRRVEVVDGELVVEQAHLPVELISRGVVVPASAKSAALGRQLDPAAFVRHRPWIKTMALVVLDDPEDPTPYWLISTRRPAELLAALGHGDSGPGDSSKS